MPSDNKLYDATWRQYGLIDAGYVAPGNCWIPSDKKQLLEMAKIYEAIQFPFRKWFILEKLSGCQNNVRCLVELIYFEQHLIFIVWHLKNHGLWLSQPNMNKNIHFPWWIKCLAGAICIAISVECHIWFINKYVIWVMFDNLGMSLYWAAHNLTLQVPVSKHSPHRSCRYPNSKQF